MIETPDYIEIKESFRVVKSYPSSTDSIVLWRIHSPPDEEGTPIHALGWTLAEGAGERWGFVNGGSFVIDQAQAHLDSRWIPLKTDSSQGFIYGIVEGEAVDRLEAELADGQVLSQDVQREDTFLFRAPAASMICQLRVLDADSALLETVDVVALAMQYPDEGTVVDGCLP